MFPPSMAMQHMTGMSSGPTTKKKKTRRGKRGGKKKHGAVNAHHAQAQTHLQNAAAAPNPQAALGHLFKGLTALNKAKSVTAPAMSAQMPPTVPPQSSQAMPQSGGMPNG